MYDEQCKVSNANVEMAVLSSSSLVKRTERTGLPKLIASASQQVIDAATCTGQPYHRLIIIQMICGNQRHKTAQSDVLSLLYPPLYLPVQNCLCVPHTLVCRTHTFRHTERASMTLKTSPCQPPHLVVFVIYEAHGDPRVAGRHVAQANGKPHQPRHLVLRRKVQRIRRLDFRLAHLSRASTLMAWWRVFSSAFIAWRPP